MVNRCMYIFRILDVVRYKCCLISKCFIIIFVKDRFNVGPTSEKRFENV